MKTKFKRSIGLILAAFTGFSLFSCAGAGVQNSSSSGNKNLENEYIEEAASTATARWMDGSEFTPVVRFAAAADTHLNEKYVVDSDRRVENLFTDAYRYARSQEYDKLDAVIFCGDVCERGKEKEYINLRNAWTKNIQPETIFLCLQAGHELIDGTEELHKQYTGNESLGMHVKINGYHFITISNQRFDKDGNATNTVLTEESNLEWIEEQMGIAHADDETKPIFTFTHHPVTDTIIASQSQKPVWNEEPVYADLFKSYQNNVNFSGHLHTPNNHPRAIMQTEFTSLSCGPVIYSGNTSDIGNVTVDGLYGDYDSYGAGFLIVEADAKGRIRVLPYNLADRCFYHEIATGQEDKQLIRYIEDVTDKSTWLYTEERWETSEKPYFEEGSKIHDEISFGYDYYKDSDGSYKYGTTLKFNFDVASDDDGIEFYQIYVRDKETGKKIRFHSLDIQKKHRMDEFMIQTSRYYLPQVYEWLPFESNVIEDGDLVVGKTYVIEVQAVDAFHKYSDDVLKKEFTFEGANG